MTSTSRPPEPIILASRSPRRQEILRRLGLSFRVEPADIDESTSPGLPPREQAMAAAVRKAAAVARRVGRGLVLGADTLVVLDGKTMGKPADALDARGMLGRLAGRTHVVTTGIALIDVERGARLIDWADTRVHMRPASEDEIDAYIATGEPMDKAGAYAIQGEGARFIAGIEGCYYNVVGLPVERLHRLLGELTGDPAPFTIPENP